MFTANVLQNRVASWEFAVQLTKLYEVFGVRRSDEFAKKLDHLRDSDETTDEISKPFYSDLILSCHFLLRFLLTIVRMFTRECLFVKMRLAQRNRTYPPISFILSQLIMERPFLFPNIKSCTSHHTAKIVPYDLILVLLSSCLQPLPLQCKTKNVGKSTQFVVLRPQTTPS